MKRWAGPLILLRHFGPDPSILKLCRYKELAEIVKAKKAAALAAAKKS